MAGYGAFRLLELGWENLTAALIWLAAGVFLHDAVLAPATIAVAALGTAALPARLQATAAGGFLVLGAVTLTAVPVLGRFGATEDNPTLLDRDYTAGWLVLLTLVLGGVGVSSALGAVKGRLKKQPPRPAHHVEEH
jgi:hypothetical protein